MSKSNKNKQVNKNKDKVHSYKVETFESSSYLKNTIPSQKNKNIDYDIQIRKSNLMASRPHNIQQTTRAKTRSNAQHYDSTRSQNRYNPKDYIPHQSFQKLSNKMVDKIISRTKGCRNYHRDCIHQQLTKNYKKDMSHAFFQQQNKQNQNKSLLVPQFKLLYTPSTIKKEKTFQKPYDSVLLEKNIQYQSRKSQNRPSIKKIQVFRPKIVYDSLKDNRLCGVNCCDQGNFEVNQDEVMQIISKFK